MRVLDFTLLFVTVSIIPPEYEAYRILGIFPLNAKSHFMMLEELMKGLAKRGHEIDVISHFPLKKPFPNYTDIISLAGSIADVQNNVTYKFAKSHLRESPLAYRCATQYGGDLCDFMDHPRFREIIENPPKDPPYDLVVTEILGSTCYFALGQHFKVPVVGVITSAMLPWANDLVSNPDEPAYVPHIWSGLDGLLNFWQRIVNVLTLLRDKWEFKYYSAYQHDKIQKYIGSNAQSLEEAEKSVSLILVNTHHSLNGAKPQTTAVVEVGGLHIPEIVEPLPNDLQQWLDDSKDGFVYMSFGSMVKIESLPEESLSAIYASLAKLAPVRVLMKIAKPEELPPNLPSNVLTSSWIPQLAVLGHKHARAFVTHGGLMGTQESVYCGVPMIGVPLYADQFQNVKLYVRKNVAVALDIEQLTEANLDTAFEAVLDDPSYTKAAKKLSAEFRDRPMTPMNTAAFWVEYVVRHGGTNLRSPAMDLTWWQIALLDVYGALLLSTALAVYVTIFLISKLIKIVAKSEEGGDIPSIKKMN